MAKKFIILLLVLLVILTVSCEEPTDEKLFYEIQKTFNNMESYRCISNITVYGNKSKSQYVAKHIFKRPNKYIIEMVEPVESKGFITVYNGIKAWFYHPAVGQMVSINNFQESTEQNMFIGYFLKNIFTNEYIQLESQNVDGKDFLIVTTEIPGNNKYRYKEKLWFDKKNLMPYKLQVYDKDGDISLEVIYTEIKYNIPIKDEDFSIEVNTKMIKSI